MDVVNTLTTYTGDGSNQNYAVPFAYLDADDVYVTVNGEAATFTWINPSLIQITEAPASGAEVAIYRLTPADVNVEFLPNRAPSATALNESYQQPLFIAKEARDRAFLQVEETETAVELATLARNDATLARNDATLARNDAAIAVGEVEAIGQDLLDHLADTVPLDIDQYTVVDVRRFGATGDGVTDDGAAINAAITYLRTFDTVEAGWETTRRTLLFPPGRYRTTVSLNFTSLRSYNTTVVAYGATIIGEVPNGIIVDALDTRFLTWRGGTIYGPGNGASSPMAGLVHGRRRGGRIADTIRIYDLIITGQFNVACYANLQAETTHVFTSVFTNSRPTFRSCAALLCGNGAHGITSAYLTPVSRAISFNCAAFYGCNFKTFDSDGTTRGAGYAVRMVTDYTDRAAIRDVAFLEHYSNAIASPTAVRNVDYNVAVFYVDGFVHNLTIEGRCERRGYIDAVLRIKNIAASAKIKGLKIREHYMAAKAGLIQAEGDDFPVIITGGHLSATLSQGGLFSEPAPAGTIFGANSIRSGSSQLYFTGVVDIPDDFAQDYRLNDFTNVVQFNGSIYSRAPFADVVLPPLGNYTLFCNNRVYHGGTQVFQGGPIYGAPIQPFVATRATLPSPLGLYSLAAVTDPEVGRRNLVMSGYNGSQWIWTYVDNGAVVGDAPVV